MKNRFCILRLFACLFALLLAAGVARAQEHADIRAHEQALSWLKLLDEGKYDASWDEAAALFRDNILREEWITMLKKNRTALGKVKERKFLRLMRSHTLPDAPEGNYIVFVFETAFAGRSPAASEFVVLGMTDRRGNLLPAIEPVATPEAEPEVNPPLESSQWRPLSYYVNFEAEASPSPQAQQQQPSSPAQQQQPSLQAEPQASPQPLPQQQPSLQVKPQ